MQKFEIKQKSLTGLFFIILAVLWGCQKEPSTIGLNVQPSGDKVTNVLSSSLGVAAYSFKEDHISSDERKVNILGTLDDPAFGTTTSSIVTQIRLPSSNVNFGTSPIAESIVLQLKISGHYGDESINPQPQQRLRIYEFTGTIKPADTLYSDYPIKGNYDSTSTPLFDSVFVPNINDTVLRIKLNNSLATKILTSSSANLADADVFATNVFKGLYIKSSASTSSGKMLLYLDLLSDSTKLIVYYKNAAGPQAPFNLVINSLCARISIFENTPPPFPLYTLADTATLLSNPPTQVFVQSMCGPKIYLKLPSLRTYKDSGNLAINQAELILKADPTSMGNFAPPARLFLVLADVNNKYLFLKDYLRDKTYFGGYYQPATHSYKFNIPIHVQELISGKQKDYGMYIFPEANRESGSRVKILNSGSDKIELKFTYTKL